MSPIELSWTAKKELFVQNLFGQIKNNFKTPEEFKKCVENGKNASNVVWVNFVEILMILCFTHSIQKVFPFFNFGGLPNCTKVAIMQRRPLILLLSWFLFSSNTLHGLEYQQSKSQTKVVMTGSVEGGRNTLKGIEQYAELKNDQVASLPSSFTICVSVLATTQNGLWPTLFSLLRNDGFQSFSAEIRHLGDFVGRNFYICKLTNMRNLTLCQRFQMNGFEAV